MYPLQNREESTVLWKKTPFLIVIWWPVFLFWECESEPRHYRSDLGALTGGADPEYRRLLTALSGSVVCQRQVMESSKEAAFPFPPLPKAISFSFLAENDVSVTVFSFKGQILLRMLTRHSWCSYLQFPGAARDPVCPPLSQLRRWLFTPDGLWPLKKDHASLRSRPHVPKIPQTCSCGLRDQHVISYSW